jgi:hypothetical protein
MPAPKINVQAISSDRLPDDVLMLGDAIAKRAKIPVGQPLTLQFGSFSHHVTIINVPRNPHLRISQTLSRRMGLVSDATLRLKYSAASRTLKIGPLIGVLVSRELPGQPGRPFGDMTAFCRELTEACRKDGAYVYFFTPAALGSSSGWVHGWIYRDGWIKTMLPAPDVVYNRLTTRKLENQQDVQNFLKTIKSRYGSHVFNEKFLDKSEVFDALRKDVLLHRYLPQSQTLTGYPVLKKMCREHAVVFLKPVRGSLGKGIIRIQQEGPNSWQAAHATLNGTRKVSYPSLDKLYASLSGKMKSVRYLIQQGLHLIQIDGRPIDFRALVQKNGSGNWIITSLVCRTASANHFVSNVARGGTLSKARYAIAKSNLPAASKLVAVEQLHRAALDIAKGIDKHIPAHFGELGIDLAIDTGGRVWLLEVNAKPSKNDNAPLKEGKIRPSVRMIIQYARFLSGF